jgi:hypothetical protein
MLDEHEVSEAPLGHDIRQEILALCIKTGEQNGNMD